MQKQKHQISTVTLLNCPIELWETMSPKFYARKLKCQVIGGVNIADSVYISLC